MALSVYRKRYDRVMRAALLPADRRIPFAVLATVLVAFEATIVRSDVYRVRPDVFALAVLIDLLIVLPLVFWAMVVRTGKATPRAVLTIGALGALAASYVLPDPPAFLAPLRWLPAFAEVALLVWGIVQGRAFFRALRRRARESDDVLMNVHHALQETPGIPPALQAMVAETTALWYGLCAFRMRTADAPNRFAYHEPLVVIMVLGLLATPAEGLVFHVLLRNWSDTAAWIGTGLHVYSAIWMVALYQAARLRPHVLDNGVLTLRWSLIWTGDLPLPAIRRAVRLKERPEVKPKGLIDLARLGDRPFLLELDEAATLHGPLGIRKTGESLLLAVDNPARFEAALRNAGVVIE